MQVGINYLFQSSKLISFKNTLVQRIRSRRYTSLVGTIGQRLKIKCVPLFRILQMNSLSYTQIAKLHQDMGLKRIHLNSRSLKGSSHMMKHRINCVQLKKLRRTWSKSVLWIVCCVAMWAMEKQRSPFELHLRPPLKASRLQC
ncbi:hypothetical protein D3C77_568460 [compost metagenome]